MKYFILIFIWMIGLAACSSKPKVITAEATPQEQNADQSLANNNPHQIASSPATEGQDLDIKPLSGGTTLAELINNKEKYEGQTVKVQGRVVKINNMIMQKNWIHLKDASLKDSKLDLTVTTTDNVTMGEVVAVEGKISINKDFGSGYTYEVIMEEAHIIK
jgi:starvation-inducible outer membrane lipoprotein